jgi:hypothetical protein
MWNVDQMKKVTVLMVFCLILPRESKTPKYRKCSRGAVNLNMTAENIPVEPDQDNACAGKVRVSILPFPVFVNPQSGLMDRITKTVC